MARVMIVDDEELPARWAAAVLAEAGHACEIHSSAVAALRALRQNPAAIVITDWNMPGMDGIELLCEIRQRHPAIKVLLLTGFTSDSHAATALREGAADFLTKPVDCDELREAVSRALNARPTKSKSRAKRVAD